LCSFHWKRLREIDYLEDPGVDKRIILKEIFRNGMRRHVLDLSGSGQGQMAGTCECGNEPAGSIKWQEIFDLMRNSQLLRKDSIVI